MHITKTREDGSLPSPLFWVPTCECYKLSYQKVEQTLNTSAEEMMQSELGWSHEYHHHLPHHQYLRIPLSTTLCCTLTFSFDGCHKLLVASSVSYRLLQPHPKILYRFDLFPLLDFLMSKLMPGWELVNLWPHIHCLLSSYQYYSTFWRICFCMMFFTSDHFHWNILLPC